MITFPALVSVMLAAPQRSVTSRSPVITVRLSLTAGVKSCKQPSTSG